MLLYLRLLMDTLRRSGARRQDLLWENLALRQQLAVYQRQTHRLAVEVLGDVGSVLAFWPTHLREHAAQIRATAGAS